MKITNNGVLFSHSSCSQSQTGSNDSWQTFGNGSYCEGHGNLEVVDGTFDPRATVGRVREMADIDEPHGDADYGDDLRKGWSMMSCDRREHMYYVV